MVSATGSTLEFTPVPIDRYCRPTTMLFYLVLVCRTVYLVYLIRYTYTSIINTVPGINSVYYLIISHRTDLTRVHTAPTSSCKDCCIIPMWLEILMMCYM